MDIGLDGLDELHKPQECPECGGHMIYKGVGEYECEKCKHIEFDDYGKVRNYLEENKGATAFEIQQGTGISQRVIRTLIRDERIEVSKNSRVFMKCKMCGADIRLGDLCSDCQKKQERIDLQKRKENRNTSVKGYGKGKTGEDGAKRFRRER